MQGGIVKAHDDQDQCALGGENQTKENEFVSMWEVSLLTINNSIFPVLLASYKTYTLV